MQRKVSFRAAVWPQFLNVLVLLITAAVATATRAGETTIVPAGSVWRYKVGTTVDGWKGNIYDQNWASGPAKLGFGDSNVVTVTETNAAPHVVTTYFRNTFVAQNSYTGLVVNLLRDDGAVVYLNGTEVARSNMPDGTITSTTLATAAVGDAQEDIFYAYSVSPSLLHNGTNFLAVEVHQVSVESSDLGFDLKLVGISSDSTSNTLPVVSIEATQPLTGEPIPGALVTPGQFTVRRTGPTNTTLLVSIGLGGTATYGTDYYTAVSNIVRIEAGHSQAVFYVQPKADDLSEGDETVTAEVNVPSGDGIVPTYQVDSAHANAVVTIHDEDKDPTVLPVVGIVAEDSIATEQTSASADTGKFVLTRSGPTNDVLEVQVYIEGTATAGIDYVAVSNVVKFMAGQTNAFVFINAYGDRLVEGEEYVAMEIKPATNYAIAEGKQRAVVLIEDSPPALPIVSLVATRAETTEPLPGQSAVTPGIFTLRRSGPTNDALTVYLFIGGTATAGKDYIPVTNSLTFAAGRVEMNLYVMPLSDGLVEGDETVVAEISLPPTAGMPQYNWDPDHHRAVVTIHDINHPAAHIDITQPTNGMSFAQGAPIPIKATAVDPAGYIPRVEFYDGTNRIGVSEIAFLRAPDPGTPVYHEFQWSGATVGDHSLTARGTSSSGIIVTSAPVTIHVVASTQVILAVETVDGSATEPNPLMMGPMIDTGLFVIKRVGGPTNIAVSAYYRMTGTASNGVDYAKLSGAVELGTNQMRAEVHITPLSDDLKEGDETAVLELMTPVCVATYPPPPDCYLLGSSSTGTVVIHDQPIVENHAPLAVITKPLKGAVFTVGDSIEIVGEGSDPDGFVAKMELYADEHNLGVANTNRISINWTNAAVGTHYLVAKATDNQGKVGESVAVAILVREKNAAAFVFRHLPDAYTPGTAFSVQLRAEPPATARAWAVEDHPPVGWTVSQISNDGFFDGATGKVKFGPFTDATARTLTYMVTPPASATLTREFFGTGSIDGASYPVGGDQSIQPGAKNHPADTNADFRIVIDELTSYAGAWKRDTNLVNPIPLSYVTRAGYLWKHGETYAFNGNFAPPFCWVPSNAPAASEITATSVEVTERSGATLFQPGVSADLQINIAPPAGTSAYGVEEKLPVGWTVSNISDEGTFEANSRTIRWGIFYDSAARSLKYTVTPPTNVVEIGHPFGVVSFDGHAREITGLERLISVDDTHRPRLEKCERDGGGIRVHLSGEPGQVGILQRSTDLNTWQDLTTIFLPDGAVDYLDQSASGEGNVYYRLQVR